MAGGDSPSSENPQAAINGARGEMNGGVGDMLQRACNGGASEFLQNEKGFRLVISAAGFMVAK